MGSGSGSGGPPNYAQLFGSLASSARPVIEVAGETFSVTYPVANGDDWKMSRLAP